VGCDSSVGIATGYGLDVPGIESRLGERFSAPVQTGPGAHPASCTMCTGSFPAVKSGRGMTLTPHPLLVPLVMKEYSYTSTPPMGRTACTGPQCLYKGALYLYLTRCRTGDVVRKDKSTLNKSCSRPKKLVQFVLKCNVN